jgi:UTP--glucose-1-phosphate uridylyltransferase
MVASSFRPVRKAVIPVAGLGTRMLPITKVVPKEMLPVVSKPLIQYAVEEVAASGIKEIILVTRGRTLAEDYFSNDVRFEELLPEHNRPAELESLRRLCGSLRISAVRQDRPLGLGDALRCARAEIGAEPFALVLPDALIQASRPALGQMLAAYQQWPGSYIATQSVNHRDTVRFGMLEVAEVDHAQFSTSLFRVLNVVEKPQPDEAPSAYGVFGRYLLDPAIFEYFDRRNPDHDTEREFADALAALCQRGLVYALRFEGRHFDAGDRLGYLEAVVEFSLADPDIGEEVRRYLMRAQHPVPEMRELGRQAPRNFAGSFVGES